MKKIILFVLAVICSSTVFADFQSPSGNIVCSNAEELTCFLYERSNSRPAHPKPRECRADWGNMFSVGAKGRAQMNCYIDTDVYFDYSDMQTLPYGSSLQGNGWMCNSQTTGMTCKNTQGHGFHLSRKKQSVF